MGVRKAVARLLRRWFPGGSLGERTLFSGLWVFSTNIVNRGLNLVMLVVLARLLGPSAMGIYGMAMITKGALENFTETGLEEALIQQKEENVDEILHTAWVISVGRGLLIGIILYLGAPYVAWLFDDPSLTDILHVFALAPVIFGLRNPGVVYFRKALEFHKQFAYRISGSVAQFVVGVGLGFYWRSVWALIVAYIAMDFTRTVASYYTHGFRPRFDFDVDGLKELFRFGKWVTGSSILNYLYSRGDDVIVGFILSSTALGWYQMAYRLARAPVSEVSGTVSTVLFPTFSKLQDNPEQLLHAFFRAFRITLFVSLPMSFGIIGVAPVFVEAFLGQAWIPMTRTFQLVAVYGLLVTVGPTFNAVWRAVGRPDFSTKLMLIRVVIMGILIVPATRSYGIEGAALTIIAISIVPNLPLNFYLLVEHTLDTSYRRIGKEIAYPFLGSSVMLAVVVGAREMVDLSSPIVEFVLLVSAGVVVYGAASLVLTTSVGWQVGRDIKWLIDTAAGPS